jgi:hypothetical protein
MHDQAATRNIGDTAAHQRAAAAHRQRQTLTHTQPNNSTRSNPPDPATGTPNWHVSVQLCALARHTARSISTMPRRSNNPPQTGTASDIFEQPVIFLSAPEKWAKRGTVDDRQPVRNQWAKEARQCSRPAILDLIERKARLAGDRGLGASHHAVARRSTGTKDRRRSIYESAKTRTATSAIGTPMLIEMCSRAAISAFSRLLLLVITSISGTRMIHCESEDDTSMSKQCCLSAAAACLGKNRLSSAWRRQCTRNCSRRFSNRRWRRRPIVCSSWVCASAEQQLPISSSTCACSSSSSAL